MTTTPNLDKAQTIDLIRSVRDMASKKGLLVALDADQQEAKICLAIASMYNVTLRALESGDFDAQPDEAHERLHDALRAQHDFRTPRTYAELQNLRRDVEAAWHAIDAERPTEPAPYNPDRASGRTDFAASGLDTQRGMPAKLVRSEDDPSHTVIECDVDDEDVRDTEPAPFNHAACGAGGGDEDGGPEPSFHGDFFD